MKSPAEECKGHDVVLVDTSVWIAHLRHGAIGLEALLYQGRVMCHPFIVGELACGNIRNRSEIISLLQRLPGAIPAGHEEVIQFIEHYGLMGQGLGYTDMHLLASAKLTGVPLWTLDKRLNEAAKKLGLSP
jgi:predicted nucleic acid-binding protein